MRISLLCVRFPTKLLKECCYFRCFRCKYKKFPFKTGQEHKNIAERFELISKRNIQSEPTLLNNNTQISKPIKINDLEQYFLTSLEDDPEDNQITQQFEVSFYLFN
jgi:hypothetical protein